VAHGWFLEPEPEYEGDLTEALCADALNAGVGALVEQLAELPEMLGTLTMRIDVAPGGECEGFELLTNTLMSKDRADPEEARAEVLVTALNAMLDIRFPETAKGGAILFPLIFS